ncbi:hypothetical protein LENED_000354 [Lentinula edodes]|uniref:Uncharacterized protein n=1 Tax=Lentinula edodes TaxID=5353 RepID=A0A1Q3DVC9_LENED|nr:hypothetical protein LENED_000354 [Lentinula edodes]
MMVALESDGRDERADADEMTSFTTSGFSASTLFFSLTLCSSLHCSWYNGHSISMFPTTILISHTSYISPSY